ncbi:sulfotransferase [Luteolibacter sp. Populi]|uniref:tetratricopeptide repeat-containing sulfotransferase family protein n=1 Tax=Luteolibacter sp. Populi TaxID=3230487 RepID=UPI0034672B6B
MRAEAIEALERGDIDAALALWSRITAGDASAASLLEHATLLQQLYRSGEASLLWERLLDHPGATTDHLLAAGKQWFQLVRFAGCARFTARAMELDPNSPDTAAMHAAALERAGEKEQAEQVIRGTLERHPHHLRLVRLLAHIERRDGRFQQAQERLEKQLAAVESAEDWRLRYELAAVLDRMGDYPGAMRELELAKRQLEPASASIRPTWRAMTDRQWELTRALSPERLRSWQAPALGSPRRICLLAGFPRSGTTLLEQVITTHPGCIGTDESGILSTQFRDPIVFGASSAANVLTELDGYDEAALTAGRAEYFRCTADVLGEDPGNRMLIEKDPLLTADLAVPLRLFPEAKLLIPLRDPRDVVISFYFTIVPGAPNSVASATLAESCQYYAEMMRHWLLLRERLDPSRWMESRYEDLLADPEQQTRQLAAFLGLVWRPEMLAHHQRSGARAIGTPTYDDVSKPLYTRSLERWRHYEAWLEPHMHHLQPYLDAFGYR